jgi:hypothetical protein
MRRRSVRPKEGIPRQSDGILSLPSFVLARILRLSEEDLYVQRYYELVSVCFAFKLALESSGAAVVARIW